MNTPDSKKAAFQNRRVYKFVDLAVADVVASGSLRIGTLAGYAKLEGTRRDAGENTTTTLVRHAVVDKDTPHLSSMIRVKGRGSVLAENNMIIMSGKNYYCFCASSTKDAKPDGEYAAFAIDDLFGLVKIITMQNQKLGTRGKIGFVKYAPRSMEFTGRPIVQPDPFIKDTSFQWENEVRVLWSDPERDTITSEQQWSNGVTTQGLQPFNTKPNAEIAKFLKRI